MTSQLLIYKYIDMMGKIKTLDPGFGKAIFVLTMIIEVQYMMKMLLLYNLGCKKMFVVWHVHKTVNNFTNVSNGPPLVTLVKSVTFACQNCSGFIVVQMVPVSSNRNNGYLKVGTTSRTMITPLVLSQWLNFLFLKQ